ncbi:MAG: ABC transporter permease [Gemmatimonadetes bacterium]|nr:ABC transporter permease [Gemmatimonadota bacterium]NNM05372.1 ABC transporter permease [Gemmatimonadota bacterium]
MNKERAGSTGLADLMLDVRHAVRALLRTPGFTIVAFLTLALGIGATTAMFSVTDAALGRALPFPEAGRLVLCRATFSGNVNPWVSFPDYQDYRDQAESLESLATIGGRANLVTVTGGDEPEQVRMTFITANLFETLGTPPRLGRTFTIEELPGEGAGQVVISHGFWQRWYGEDPDVLGRTLIIDGSAATVMGVMPAGFRFMFDSDLWVPPWPGNSNPITRRFHNWLLVGRLSQGASLETARSEVDLISTHLEEAFPESNQTKALQLDDLQGAMVEGYRPSLLILIGAIVLVLLIACSNVASLLMARGSTRTSEMALRAALGAGRGQLARQLLVECVVLALAAGAMGVVVAVWLQELILGFVSMDLLGLQDIGMSSTMLGTALALSLGTVLVFGIVPSIVTSGANPAEDLKEGSRGSTAGAGSRFRNGLVVLQVALSLVLLVGSGLLLRSFAQLRGVDPGFRVESLLTGGVTLPDGRFTSGEERTQFFASLKESIEALPGVQSVAMVNQLPILQPSGNVAIWAPERPPEANVDAPWADRRIIMPGYFETMEIPMVEGRGFGPSDVAEAPGVIVLSRRTAGLVFPDESALGRQVAVDIGGDEPGFFEVVGVVEDHQLSSLSGETRPAMFFPYAQWTWGGMRIAVASNSDPMRLFRPIQERIWELDRDIVLSDPQTMEQAVAGSISNARALTTVLGVFAAVAIGLAALGLYGVLAYFVSRRVHEIGIRVALGASGNRVLKLVVSRGLTLVGVGSVLGITASFAATRLVEGMLFQVSATDLTTYLGVTLLFAALALGACVIPAWRALTVDPVEAFRAE